MNISHCFIGCKVTLHFCFPCTNQPFQNRSFGFVICIVKLDVFFLHERSKMSVQKFCALICHDFFRLRPQAKINLNASTSAGATSVLKHYASHGTGTDMGLHGCTFPVFTAFISNMSGAIQPIQVIIDDVIKKEVETNRGKLSSICDTVLKT